MDLIEELDGEVVGEQQGADHPKKDDLPSTESGRRVSVRFPESQEEREGNMTSDCDLPNGGCSLDYMRVYTESDDDSDDDDDDDAVDLIDELGSNDLKHFANPPQIPKSRRKRNAHPQKPAVKKPKRPSYRNFMIEKVENLPIPQALKSYLAYYRDIVNQTD